MRLPPFRRSLAWRRVVGVTLLATGALGMILSLTGMIFVIYAGAAAQAALNRELDTLDEALGATREGLVIAGTALSDAQLTLGSLGATVEGATRTISQTLPTINTLQVVARDELPQTISSTRLALEAAGETARVADNVLSALRIIGLQYNPAVPLSTAIGDVSNSLSNLPTSLDSVSQGLALTSTNVGSLADDLREVSAGLGAIQASVGEATAVVGQYRIIVDGLRDEVVAVREAAPGWLRSAQVGLLLLLLWLGLAQVGLLLQGWEQLDRARRRGEL